ncbi:MAG: hypothetical protein EXR72_26785 [Myxococcales bacterium]|nr:hypothetical protein [Myxococcales bacterium]
MEEDDPRNALKNLVGRLCKPDGEVKAHGKEFDAARQKWSQRLDLTEADWADAADYATLGQGERMNGRVRVNTNGQEIGIGESLKRAWSSFDALDQYAMITADSGASGDLALDHHYLVDALGARLTEVGRFAYLQRCVKSSNNGPVQWAMCQGDIERLDRKKLASELRANKVYTGADKVRIRIEVDALKPDLVAHAAKGKKLLASDPGYAKLFEAADATRKEWEGRYQSDGALIGLAAAMDDARATRSRKAFAGCEENTWAAWKGAMGAIPAKKFEGMHDNRANGKSFFHAAMGPIISHPGVYLASVALVTCMTVGQERDAKHDLLIRALGDAMERWPGFRGPRTATHSAILTSGIELDDRDAKLEYPGVSRSFGGGGGGYSGGGDGVIGKLSPHQGDADGPPSAGRQTQKPSAKTVTVAFKKQMVKQVQCAQVKFSRRVTQIRSDGTIVYESTCIKNETVTVDKADGPQTVNARYLEGVKPGMFVSIIEDVVTAAWAKPGAAIPSMVFGVALK